MRKIHNIILDNIDNGERVKAVDIISKALSKEFGKSCAVFQEGHFSECAIEAIPASVSVFVIKSFPKVETILYETEPQLIVNPDSRPRVYERSSAIHIDEKLSDGSPNE